MSCVPSAPQSHGMFTAARLIVIGAEKRFTRTTVAFTTAPSTGSPSSRIAPRRSCVISSPVFFGSCTRCVSPSLPPKSNAPSSNAGGMSPAVDCSVLFPSPSYSTHSSSRRSSAINPGSGSSMRITPFSASSRFTLSAGTSMTISAPLITAISLKVPSTMSPAGLSFTPRSYCTITSTTLPSEVSLARKAVAAATIFGSAKVVSPSTTTMSPPVVSGFSSSVSST